MMQPTQTTTPGTDAKGVSILARSLFKQMQQQGFTEEQIIGLSTELLQLVSEGMQKRMVAE
jgi:hypothetical protein